MDRFARSAEALGRAGVRPDPAMVIGTGGTYQTVLGYTWRHLALAFLGGAIVAAQLVSGYVVATDRWIAGPAERRAVQAIAMSTVDVTAMSTKELAARLQVPSPVTQAFMEISDVGFAPAVHDIGTWLLTLSQAERRPALLALMDTVHSAQASPEVLRLIYRFRGEDPAVLKAVREAIDDSPGFLRQFAALGLEDRRNLAIMDFPIRASDTARARLWEVINAHEFPAADLVAPLAEIAKTAPTRLKAIQDFVAQKGELPRCRPTACSTAGFRCPSGQYPTTTVSCVYQ